MSASFEFEVVPWRDEGELEDEFEEEFGRRRSFPAARPRPQPFRPRPPTRRPPRRQPIIQPSWPVGGPPYGEPDDAGAVPPSGSEHARWAQSCLNQMLGLRLSVNGIMDAATRSAVRSFQKQRGLRVDGIVGPPTQSALAAACEQGSTPSKGAPPPSAGELSGEAWELEGEWQGEVDRRSRDYKRWVQASLNRVLRTRLVIDGIVGALTRSAIRNFQQRQELTVDGMVGPRTEAALVAAGAGQPPGRGTASRPPTSRAVDTPLPSSGPGYYSTKPQAQRYGLAATIHALQAIGAAWRRAHPQGPRIGFGDISLRGGGPMPGHKSHRLGVDVDVRLMRNDGQETATEYRSAHYSLALTQQLIDLVRANGVLPVRFIFFNDPAATGVSVEPNHHNHLHIRFGAPTSGAGATAGEYGEFSGESEIGGFA